MNTNKGLDIFPRSTTATHTLFVQFSCGHEYFDKRRAGSVSGCDNCLCDSCQPYHAVIAVNHPCRLCGGSFSYFTNTPQTLLSDEEAARRINNNGSSLRVPFT